MPNPHSPGYHAHTEHGRLHLSAPHLSSLPQPFRPHRFTVQCLPALPVTFPSLGSWSPQVLMWSPAAHTRGGPRAGRLWGGSWLAELWLPLLSSHPKAKQEQSMGCPLPSSILTETWHSLELQVPDLHQSCGIGADRGCIPTCSTMGLLTND